MFQKDLADDNASDGEESLAKVIKSFVTDLEATALVQPNDIFLFFLEATAFDPNTS